jgi:hypothetical protein
MTVVNFSDYKKEKDCNVTHELFSQASFDYESLMLPHSSNFDVAADVALIKFLMKGAAHRVSGEVHPSQKILDSIHTNLR